MNNKHELAVNNIPSTVFSIPHYQRGYRWTDKEVEALLNDLLAFSQSDASDDCYCLQPLVLQEMTDGSIRVVDGQQRLTTLAIILWSLGVSTNWDIKYTAEGGRLLKDLLKDSGGSINDHFRTAAKRKVENWLCESPVRKDSLLRVLQGECGKRVEFLRYDLPKVEASADDQDEGHGAFQRLNAGKTPLTSSELIRALFMESGNGLTDGEKADIAKEWDLIESAMTDNQFWAIWNNDDFCDVPTRMDFLFSIVANVDSKKARQDGLRIYRGMEDKVQKETLALPDKDRRIGLKKVWENTLRCWWWMQSCYSDEEAYHLLGWVALFTDRGGPGLWKIWSDEGCRMEAFKQRLRKIVVEKTGCDFDSFRYDESNPAELRGLFVLLNSLEARRRHIRFRFDLYRRRRSGWDIEHIASQTDNSLTDINDEKEWLCLALDEKSEYDAVKLDGCKTFDEKRARILDMFLKGADGDIDKDDMGNLALLDAETNRAYKNAIFPAKRRTILGKALNDVGGYIPPVTEAAFSKSYSSVASQMRYWGKKDADKYREGMKELFEGFIKKAEGGAR